MEAKDEILRIQRMVAEGKVSPEDSVELIEALGRTAEPKPAPDGARRLTKELAGALSFYALLAAAGCAVMAQVLESAGSPYRPNQIAATLAALFAGLAVIAGVASYVLGRMAITEGALSGEPLSGRPRMQASISPVIVAALVSVLVIVVLPIASFFALEQPICALLSGGFATEFSYLRGYLAASESEFTFLLAALWVFCAAAVFAVVAGLAALLVRRWIEGLRAVFAPLLNGLALRHFRRLLIASGVSAALAVASLVIFLVLRGRIPARPVRDAGRDEPGAVTTPAQ